MDKTVALGNNDDVGGFVDRNVNNSAPEPYLRKGYLLKNRYEILSVLGHGGFGLTYACRDTTLDLKVAVKEYYPDGFVSRDCRKSSTVTYSTTPENMEFIEKGLRRFIDEARVLAKFSGEDGIVDVRDYFEENNTAYIVMEFLDGKDLKQLVTEQGKLPADQAVKLLLPVMESLEKVHRHGLIHRDISPDNIRMAGKKVKLLDFGAARDFSYEGNKTMTVLLKRGYAPIEQYGAVETQGPWTDVYALCATLYLCITGRKPADSLVRWENDPLKKPSELGIAISPALESVIMKGLSVSVKERYQSVKALAEALVTAFRVGNKVNPAPSRPAAPVQPPVKAAKAPAPVRPQVSDPVTTLNPPKKPAQVASFTPAQPPKKDKPEKDKKKDKPKDKKKLIIAIIAAVLVVAIVVGYIGWDSGWFYSPPSGYIDDTYYEDEANKETQAPEAPAGNVVSVEKPIRELEYDADGTLISEIEYYSNGNIAREIPYYEDGVYQYEYEFDDSGNKTRMICFFETTKGSETCDWIEYEYDNGQLVREIACDENGTRQEWAEYEYENGQLVKKIICDESEYCHSWSVYEYDEKDQLVEETLYDADGSCISQYKYEYDEKGLLVNEIHYDGYGNLVQTYEYKYDGNRLIKKDCYYYGEFDSYVEYKYE